MKYTNLETLHFRLRGYVTNDMKTIIAGGRDYKMQKSDFAELDLLGITEVISGGCSGADKVGELYAMHRNLQVTTICADWRQYGRSAGPKRNEQMAEIADAVFLFPGGKGTASMEKIAKRKGLKIYKPNPVIQ